MKQPRLIIGTFCDQSTPTSTDAIAIPLMRKHRCATALVVLATGGLLGTQWLIAQSATPPAATQPSTPATSQARIPAAPAFETTVIAEGLTAPWGVAFLPDGQALVTERSGAVRLIGVDLKMAAEPVLTVPVKAWVKMGLLGIAIDPAFAANGHVYLAENYGDAGHDRDSVSLMRVVRYVWRGGRLVEPKILIDEIPAYLNHTGGRLAFGPDGKLYVTTGDADRPPLSQDLTSLAGKILRINPDGSTPSDNPFVGRGDAQGAIWTFGHRNPQVLAFEPGSGRLYAPEHGPNGGDEINLIERQSDYGWPAISHDRTWTGMVSPLTEFTPSIGPSAATFYQGTMFPSLRGDLLVACLRGESVLRVRLDESGKRVLSVERLLHRKFCRLREVVVAPDGAIWITTSEVDPPEGRNTAQYDKIIRLTPGSGAADASALLDQTTLPRPVGAVAVYEANCRACHGNGRGPSLNTNIFDRQWTLGVRNDDDLRRIIADGVVARGMPAYKSLLTRDEIDELVRLIRNREETLGDRR